MFRILNPGIAAVRKTDFHKGEPWTSTSRITLEKQDTNFYSSENPLAISARKDYVVIVQ